MAVSRKSVRRFYVRVKVKQRLKQSGMNALQQALFFLLVIENRTAASILCTMCDEVHMCVVRLTYRAPYLK